MSRFSSLLTSSSRRVLSFSDSWSRSTKLVVFLSTLAGSLIMAHSFEVLETVLPTWHASLKVLCGLSVLQGLVATVLLSKLLRTRSERVQGVAVVLFGISSVLGICVIVAGTEPYAATEFLRTAAYILMPIVGISIVVFTALLVPAVLCAFEFIPSVQKRN